MSASLTAESDFQRLILEKAIVLARELETTANQAADGQVIDRCETLLLGAGRQFLRDCLQASMQSQAAAVEKKGRRREPVSAVINAPTKGGTNERS
jgi:hypothetical protein